MTHCRFPTRTPRGHFPRGVPLVLVLLALTLAPHSLRAHHGRDFFWLQDSAIPSALSGVVNLGLEWVRDGDDDAFSTEPGFFIGLAPALAFGLSADFADEGDGWAFQGITPQFVLSILPPVGPLNFRAGFWAGYEFAEESDAAALVHFHNPGGGPDAGGGGAHVHEHSHGGGGGIHRHGESGLYSRVIVEADLAPRTRLVLNLISFVSGAGGGPGFGYACGVRHEFTHDLALGLESQGDFRSFGSSHEVLITALVGLPYHVSLRLGLGAGLTPASPDFTCLAGLLWRF